MKFMQRYLIKKTRTLGAVAVREFFLLEKGGGWELRIFCDVHIRKTMNRINKVGKLILI